MFNKDGFEILGENIYLYKNFITEDECKLIMDEVLSMESRGWKQLTSEKHHTTWKDIDSLIPARKKIKDLLEESYYFAANLNVQRMLKGVIRPPHADNFTFLEALEASKLYVEGDDYDLADDIKLGVVLYLNNFDGGSLYYPDQDVTIKPNIGDLVIHGAEEKCRHALTEVLSPERYLYANHIYQNIKVPKGYNFTNSEPVA